MTALTIAPAQVADSYDATATGNIDRIIRISAALAVLAVAAVAAYVSYWHAYAVVRAHGETGITARLNRPRSTAWSTHPAWSSCTRHGTGCRHLPWPGGCSGWGSRPP